MSSQQGCFAKLRCPHADCRKQAPGTRAVRRDQAPQSPLPKVATPRLAQPGLNGYLCSQPDEVCVRCISAVHMDTLPAPSAPTACLALRRGFTRVQLLLLQDRFNNLCFPRRERRLRPDTETLLHFGVHYFPSIHLQRCYPRGFPAPARSDSTVGCFETSVT